MAEPSQEQLGFDVIPDLTARDQTVRSRDEVIRRPRKPSLTLEDGKDAMEEKRKASSFGKDLEVSASLAKPVAGGRFATGRRRSSSWGPGDFAWSETGGLREASFSMKRSHYRPPKLSATHSVFAAASVLSPTSDSSPLRPPPLGQGILE